MLGPVAEFDEALTVAKLRGARDRLRAKGLKVEGRKSHAELNPEPVRQAKRLRRRSPKGHQRSLREVSAALSAMGFKNANGQPFSASRVARCPTAVFVAVMCEHAGSTGRVAALPGHRTTALERRPVPPDERCLIDGYC